MLRQSLNCKDTIQNPNSVLNNSNTDNFFIIKKDLKVALIYFFRTVVSKNKSSYWRVLFNTAVPLNLYQLLLFDPLVDSVHIKLHTVL